MNHYGSHGAGFNRKGPESFVSRNAIETFLNHFPTIGLDDSPRRDLYSPGRTVCFPESQLFCLASLCSGRLQLGLLCSHGVTNKCLGCGSHFVNMNQACLLICNFMGKGCQEGQPVLNACELQGPRYSLPVHIFCVFEVNSSKNELFILQA